MELERKNWTKKFLVRLPKDAKPQNEDVDETRLIQGAFEGIYGIELDEQDIIRADHHYLKEESHKESEHLLEYSINFNVISIQCDFDIRRTFEIMDILYPGSEKE